MTSATEPTRTIVTGDLIAGLSVAAILVPQSLAYGELAGVPAYVGLFAAGVPLVAAAFFASSRYLQTGPVAMTALLTAGALAPSGAERGSAEWVQLAALLAVLVGVTRVILGLIGGGVIAYLLSKPVLDGFTTASALLIVASQLPTAVGTSSASDAILADALRAVTSPEEWQWQAVMLSVATIAAVTLGRRIHPLFPSVLVAVGAGIVIGSVTGYGADLVGAVPAGMPPFSLALPWDRTLDLLVPTIVVAVVGFAEPATIARSFATEDREEWDGDRELLGQGVANLASGVFGGIPVGGSFSRSSVNRMAGGRTRWSGAVTGVIVLAFLPFASVLSALPKAVLASIVIASVLTLFRPGRLLAIWRISKPQAAVGAITFVAVLAFAPRIDLGVVAGVAVAVVVHLWRELHVPTEIAIDGDTMVVTIKGVLFFGSTQEVEDHIADLLAEQPGIERVVIDMQGVGRIDYTAATGLRALADDLEQGGSRLELINIPPQSVRLLGWAMQPDHPQPGETPP
jgi:sulfate permease, SulP family